MSDTAIPADITIFPHILCDQDIYGICPLPACIPAYSMFCYQSFSSYLQYISLYRKNHTKLPETAHTSSGVFNQDPFQNPEHPVSDINFSDMPVTCLCLPEEKNFRTFTSPCLCFQSFPNVWHNHYHADFTICSSCTAIILWLQINFLSLPVRNSQRIWCGIPKFFTSCHWSIHTVHCRFCGKHKYVPDCNYPVCDNMFTVCRQVYLRSHPRPVTIKSSWRHLKRPRRYVMHEVYIKHAWIYSGMFLSQLGRLYGISCFSYPDRLYQTHKSAFHLLHTFLHITQFICSLNITNLSENIITS